MKLPKAIEILKLILDTPPSGANPDFTAAIQLGREALKRIVYLRLDMDCPHWMTLPGETKE